MDWGEWIGKKVFLILNSGHNYSGRVTDADKQFISFIDKFGDKINVSTSEIKIIKEEER